MDSRFRDEVQVLVDGLAGQVQQSVAIDDPAGNIIAISRHYGDEDGYRLKLVLERRILPAYRDFFDPWVAGLVAGVHESPMHVPAAPDLHIVGRVGYAIRDRDRVIAILWFIDRGRALPEELIDEHCEMIADLLGERGRAGIDLDPEATRRGIIKVLSGEREPADDTVIWLAEARTQFTILVSPAITAVPAGAPASASAAGAAERDAPSPGPARILHPESAHLSSVCAAEISGRSVQVYGGPLAAGGGAHKHPPAMRPGSAMLSDSATLPGAETRVRGTIVSAPVPLSRLRATFVEAALTSFIAEHLDRRTLVHGSARFRSLVPVLTNGPTSPLAAMLLDPDSSVFETVGGLLHSGGTQAQLLETLRIHRTTLHYRLRQITERSGLDLQAPADLMLASLDWLSVAVRRSELNELLAESCS